MEPRFGHDFGKVRVHDDPRAADSARAVGARAYTVGRHVVLGAGHQSVQSTAGHELLAHELTHVVQQSSVSADLAGSLEVGDPSDVAEREADQIAHSASAGDIGLAVGMRLQRAGDLSAKPPTMTCPVATTSPANVINHLWFPRASSTLTATQKGEIAAFVQNWLTLGGAASVRVDGYASVDGPQGFNWTLSCDRARAVERELLGPLPGLLPGVPLGLITLFAHGETAEYGVAADNRQATIATAAAAPPSPPAAPAPWTVDDLKRMLDACDGGLDIWAKAKRANDNKEPNVVLGDRGQTVMLTGEITLDRTQDKCFAGQQLIQELSNLSRKADFDTLDASALAGDVAREDYIKRTEEIEYETGVQNVLAAFDSCKDRWGCRTTPKEWARAARDFEDYYMNYLSAAHKGNYGSWWDTACKDAYDRKHAGP